ncbi:cytochrome-c peroxidase [Myroides phaeus]|uniref:cytochrome-c peroxidase n=1 Tax=Myroides phaeus TaxID=702745 RepID=UPI001303D2DD|nr:cytochrome c peroxidase [Myroides phaeus]
MFKIKYIVFLSLFMLIVSCKQSENSYDNVSFNKYLLEKVAVLEQEVDHMLDAVELQKDSIYIREAFVKSRIAFKEIEWAVSYFLPHTNKSINGPALDQLDLDENKFIPAEGFQVIEEMIYSDFKEVDYKELLTEVKIVKNNVNSIRKNFDVITISDTSVLEALKMEVFQVTTLGITGFDTPESGLRFIEAEASLRGVLEALLLTEKWREAEKFAELNKLLVEAIAICELNPDKNEFDYLDYIVTYLDSIAKGVVTLQKELGIPFNQGNQVVKGEVGSLFEKYLINLNAFLPDESYYMTPAKIALGKELFFERKLSKNHVRSCSDCHHSDKAFSDGLKTSLDLQGNPLKRNTPSLNYAAYYHGQFWDMRSVTLESQSSDVITNEDEMHGNLEEIVKHLRDSESYRHKFKEVFVGSEQIEVWQLENALASYIRSLSVFSSRFDLYMRGDQTALTKKEKNGFNLFVGKGECATCHFIPVFNGTVPPYFTNSEQEVLGIPMDKEGTKLDMDLGRYVFNTDLEQLKYAFKTPTVRNAGESGPYMHNGVYETLEEVMDFYNKGGGIGLGLDVPNQTLPESPLELTDEEMSDVITFMKALSDRK